MPRSPGWLASTIAHENVHLRQLLAVHPVDGGDNYARANTVGDDVNEIQAYDWENSGTPTFSDFFPVNARSSSRRRQEHYLATSRDPVLFESNWR